MHVVTRNSNAIVEKAMGEAGVMCMAVRGRVRFRVRVKG